MIAYNEHFHVQYKNNKKELSSLYYERSYEQGLTRAMYDQQVYENTQGGTLKYETGFISGQAF